ncbi:MAG: hypothetical protein RDV41_02790 [Planctomycetota bacterium]|nr:hypothetical protein [Planctomycetota bacterium]
MSQYTILALALPLGFLGGALALLIGAGDSVSWQSLASAVVGGLVASGLMVFHYKRVRDTEYRGLLAWLCVDFVHAYERYLQNSINERTLLSFTKAYRSFGTNALARFAYVCTDLRLLLSAVKLDVMYAKIQHFINDAAMFAKEMLYERDTQAYLAKNEMTLRAQRQASEYFKNQLRSIEENMRTLLDAARRSCGSSSKQLSDHFESDAKQMADFNAAAAKQKPSESAGATLSNTPRPDGAKSQTLGLQENRSCPTASTPDSPNP